MIGIMLVALHEWRRVGKANVVIDCPRCNRGVTVQAVDVSQDGQLVDALRCDNCQHDTLIELLGWVAR